MADPEGPSPAKRRKVSLGDVLKKQKELDSAQSAAVWAIEEYENGQNTSDKPIEKRVPSTLLRLKNRIQKAKNQRRKLKKSLPDETLLEPALTNSMIDVLDGDEKATTSNPGPGRPAKNFDDVKETSQLQKLKPIVSYLKEAGQQLGGKTPTEVCGRVLKKENYQGGDRKLSHVGEAIYDGSFSGSNTQKEMFEPEALYMKTHELKLSDSQYTDLRLRMLQHGMIIPALNKVKTYEKEQRYSLIPILGGFRATLPEIAQKTLSQTLQIPEVHTKVASLDPEVCFPLKAHWHTGFDGSGSQPTAMQRSRNESENAEIPVLSQQNREMVVAVLKDVKTADGDLVFETEKIASTHSCRVYMLFPQKENREVMKEFLPFMDAEAEELRSSELAVSFSSGATIPFKNSVSLCLTDGKAVKEASGLGGAYCVLGTCSKADGHNIDKIKAGFEMNRTMQQVKETFEKVFNELIGTVEKSKNDYKVRQGVTNRPLTSQEVNKAPRPLHCGLRLYNLFQRIMYKTHAQMSSVENPQPDVDEKALVAASRLVVIEAIKRATGIVMDTPTSKGGTTDTGNAAKRFFSEEVIPVLTNLFSGQTRDNILQLHHNFSIICGVIPSKRQVDVSKFKNICTDTYLLLRQRFPTVAVSETAHMVLGHSFQLIELNEGYGLGQMSEQGLEGLNKLVRQFSVGFARQISLDANITDVIHRLQVLSNPFLLTFRRKPSCSRCKTSGDHWTYSCPKKDKPSRCNNLQEHLHNELNDEIESYLL